MNSSTNPAEVARQFPIDFVSKTMHETQPNWTQDGFGLRGQQELVIRDSARPVEMRFSIDNSQKSFATAPPAP